MAWVPVAKIGSYRCAIITGMTYPWNNEYVGDKLDVGDNPAALTSLGSGEWNITTSCKCVDSLTSGGQRNEGFIKLLISGSWDNWGWSGYGETASKASFFFFINDIR